MTADIGASLRDTGSRERGQEVVPALSGFDPARMEARLSELLALKFNWNGYRAPPVASACAERVRHFYPTMEALGLQPWITPDNNGGLVIERGGTDDYSVEFDPNGTASVYFDGLSDADAWALVGLFAQLKALDAIAMETRQGQDRETGLGAKHDSAAIAQKGKP